MKAKTVWPKRNLGESPVPQYWLSEKTHKIWNKSNCDFRWVNAFGKIHDPCGSLLMSFDGKIIGDE